MSTLYEILSDLKIPCVYSHFRDKSEPVEPPYIAYIGNGQATFNADNTVYFRANQYQIEYYFTEKNEELETELEDLLLDNGYNYEKSDDAYIEDEGVFVIYYNV